MKLLRVMVYAPCPPTSGGRIRQWDARLLRSARMVVPLSSDAGLWRRLSLTGRAVVEQRHGWEPLLERFEAELFRFVDGTMSTTAASPRPE